MYYTYIMYHTINIKKYIYIKLLEMFNKYLILNIYIYIYIYI